MKHSSIHSSVMIEPNLIVTDIKGSGYRIHRLSGLRAGQPFIDELDSEQLRVKPELLLEALDQFD